MRLWAILVCELAVAQDGRRSESGRLGFLGEALAKSRWGGVTSKPLMRFAPNNIQPIFSTETHIPNVPFFDAIMPRWGAAVPQVSGDRSDLGGNLAQMDADAPLLGGNVPDVGGDPSVFDGDSAQMDGEASLIGAAVPQVGGNPSVSVRDSAQVGGKAPIPGGEVPQVGGEPSILSDVTPHMGGELPFSGGKVPQMYTNPSFLGVDGTLDSGLGINPSVENDNPLVVEGIQLVSEQLLNGDAYDTLLGLATTNPTFANPDSQTQLVTATATYPLVSVMAAGAGISVILAGGLAGIRRNRRRGDTALMAGWRQSRSPPDARYLHV